MAVQALAAACTPGLSADRAENMSPPPSLSLKQVRLHTLKDAA